MTTTKTNTTAPSYSHLAEQVSRLMTLGGATITERQQDVLAAALRALELRPDSVR